MPSRTGCGAMTRTSGCVAPAAAICAMCRFVPGRLLAALPRPIRQRWRRPRLSPAIGFILSPLVAGSASLVTGMPVTLNSPIVTVTVLPTPNHARRVAEEHEVGAPRLRVVGAAERAGRRRIGHDRLDSAGLVAQHRAQPLARTAAAPWWRRGSCTETPACSLARPAASSRFPCPTAGRWPPGRPPAACPS